MRRHYSNTAVATTLAANVAIDAVTLDVSDATGYPDAPFTIKINDEVILVGEKTGTTFSSLTRGYDGTTAAAHSSGDNVTHVGTANVAASAISGSEEPVSNTTVDFFYTPPYAGHNNSPSEIQDNTHRLSPFLVKTKREVAEVRMYCETAGSADGVVHFGIWKYEQGYGWRLVADLGTISGWDTTGFKSKLVTGVALEPGVYYASAIAAGFTTAPQSRRGSYNIMAPAHNSVGWSFHMGAYYAINQSVPLADIPESDIVEPTDGLGIGFRYENVER